MNKQSAMDKKVEKDWCDDTGILRVGKYNHEALVEWALEIKQETLQQVLDEVKQFKVKFRFENDNNMTPEKLNANHKSDYRNELIDQVETKIKELMKG